MAFPPEFLDEIRARLSLAEVIGRRVRLQKRGREHSGLCPFHNEKSPSFTVSEDKGFYHCFGCGAHGDVIGFVMRSEGLSFPETVERLAGEAGLAVPQSSPEERAAEQRRAGLLEVLEAAAGWFEAQLAGSGGAEARAYLARRGLAPVTVAAFRLGYAPNRRGALRKALNAQGIGDDQLVQAGLLKRPDREGSPAGPPDGLVDRGEVLRDYFFNRVIFPIDDRRGRVIAFGGRTLGDSPAKYLNSPDTPLFHKGRVLYNLSRAREAARGGGELLVTEGYMDVIALSQAGFGAAVAPLGTAITEAQIAELWRLAHEPVLCLDGDAAGRRAAFRAIERALPVLKAGCSLRFALLPEGEDPDSLLQSGGAPALRQLLDGAQPLAEMLWAKVVQGGQGGRFDTPERRAALWKSATAAVEAIGDPELKDAYREDMAERFGKAFGYVPGRRGWRPQGRRGGGARGWAAGSGGAWRGADSRFAGRGGGPAGAPLPGLQRPPAYQLRRRQEQVLLAALVNHPELLIERAEDLATLTFESEDLRRFSRALLDLAAEAPDLDSDALKCHLSKLGHARILDGLLQRQVYAQGICARPETPIVDVRRVWDRLAAMQRQRQADAETLEAEQQLAVDMSERNLARLQAKQRLNEGDSRRDMDSDEGQGAGVYESD